MSLGVGNDQPLGVDGESTEVARRQRDGGRLYVIDNPALAEAAP